jgi:lipoprotein-releasing system permease protein
MVFTPFERLVALRYLRARRQQGFVSVIAGLSLAGIALGVATLIIVMSVMNGFRADLLARIQGVNAHAVVAAPQGNLTGYQAVVDRLQAAPGVTAAMPVIEGQALIAAAGRATGARVRGILPADFARRPFLSKAVTAGLGELGEDGIAIDFRLSRSLGVSVGDTIILTSPRGTPTPFGTMLRRRSYSIYAVLDLRMPDHGPPTIYMPLAEAQSFFRMPEAVTAIDVFVADPQNLALLRQTVTAAAGPDLTVTDWRQINSSFVTALAVERVAMFIVLSLIILVASFNIISSMVMLVRGKASAIAILRSMGASQGSVLRIFLLIGAVVGVTGTIIGFGLGVAVAQNIRAIGAALASLPGGSGAPLVQFLSTLPSLIDWSEVMLVVGVGLALSVGATIYPALRAARMNPVEALRHG